MLVLFFFLVTGSPTWWIWLIVSTALQFICLFVIARVYDGEPERKEDDYV